MSTLTCRDCGKPARWNVWYKDTSLPVDDGNIAYNSLCDEHKERDVKNGREGYQVACVKPVADQFLPEDDDA